MIPDVLVIIPVYNRSDLLRDCLASLRRQTYTAFRVLVIDDASQENVAASVSEAHPEAEYVRRETNGGFARAVNDGLRRADTPLVFLLNSDMTLEPDCVEKLVVGMREAGAAMACPLVLFRDQPDTIYSAGDTILRGGRPVSIGFRQPHAGLQCDRQPFGVSAGAALYTRELFDAVGLFDEQYIAYFEDADLCMRARAAGFEAACVPEAVAYHVGSASLAGSTIWRTHQCHRNHALLVFKNYTFAQLMRDAPWILRERMHQSRRLFSAHRAAHGTIHAVRAQLAAAAGVIRLTLTALFDRRTNARERRSNIASAVAQPSRRREAGR
jgi:GT2 family glycosyltransferase